MHKRLTTEYTNIAGTVSAWTIDQAVHQQCVCLLQVSLGSGAPCLHGLVGSEGVAYFLNFAWVAQDSLAVDDCGYLLQR